MDQAFITWLADEMQRRGWNNSELARRANIVPSTVSMILSGHNRPGLDFCVSIAQAFQHPPEKVLRQAGLLPPRSTSEEELRVRDILDIVTRLTPEERQAVYEYALWRFEKQETRRKAGSKRAASEQK